MMCPLLLLALFISGCSCIADSQDDIVILTGRELTSFPSNISKSVKSIILTDNYIQSISSAEMKNFPDLMYLNLRGNLIETGDDLIGIKESRNLTVLDSSANKFARLDLMIFRENIKLKGLILDDNVNVTVSATIPKLPELEHLSLRNCRLTQIPSDFSGIPKVKILDFRGNPIFNISNSAIESLPRSVEMIFDDCPAVSDRSILDAKNITLSCRIINTKKTLLDVANTDFQGVVVNLSGQNLTYFPSNSSKTVKSMNLADNCIRIITLAEMSNFLDLTYLNLRGNQITNLDLMIFQENTKLKKLILDDNVALYATIPNLPQLEELSLRNCGLNQISSDFSGLPKVKILDFRGNPILSVSNAAIESLPKSVEIKFDNCPAVDDISLLEAKNVILSCRMANSKEASVSVVLIIVIVVITVVITAISTIRITAIYAKKKKNSARSLENRENKLENGEQLSILNTSDEQ